MFVVQLVLNGWAQTQVQGGPRRWCCNGKPAESGDYELSVLSVQDVRDVLHIEQEMFWVQSCSDNESVDTNQS